MRDQLARRLRHMGCTVVACPDGQVALETWRADPQLFAAVVCDMSMPVLDGPGLARALRSEPHFDAPFLGLTGQALQEDQELFRAAGADDVLTKPARAEHILDRLQELLALQRHDQGQPELRESKSL